MPPPISLPSYSPEPPPLMASRSSSSNLNIRSNSSGLPEPSLLSFIEMINACSSPAFSAPPLALWAMDPPPFTLPANAVPSTAQRHPPNSPGAWSGAAIEIHAYALPLAALESSNAARAHSDTPAHHRVAPTPRWAAPSSDRAPLRHSSSRSPQTPPHDVHPDAQSNPAAYLPQ